MAFKFKAPKFDIKGKTVGIPNTLVYPALGIGILGGGALLLQSHAKDFNWSLGNLFGAPKTNVPKAVRVNFNVYPNVVKPFRKIRLQGQFEDSNGVPAPVEYGYYSIFENVPSGPYFTQGRLLVSSGIVGQNVGAFRMDAPTDNFRTGPYTVYVSNKPIRSDPLAGKQAELQIAGGRPITLA